MGRGPENLLQISDPSVSGRHAQLLLADGGQDQLQDLGSTNGIRVNGEPAREALLRAGDRLRFGKVEAR
ncbi:MAG: FHA domain-containing protein [Chthoniobacterales bacterium]